MMTLFKQPEHTVIPHCVVSKLPARLPDHLDLAMMQRRHGRVIGTLRVWQSRVQARRELQRLALCGPDSVLEDAGMTRAAAEREAGRWFWQDFLT